MDPQDDPEARIRELELPLSDVARTSELGTAPTGSDSSYPLPPRPPYPPPPPPYPPPTGTWAYDAGNPAASQLPYDTDNPPTAQWPSDSPYDDSTQQWQYGTGPRPRPPGSGARAAWIIGGLAAIVGLSVAGGVATFPFTSDGIPGTPANRPTSNGGGGTLRTAPTSTVAVPSFGRSPSIEVTESAPVTALPPGGTLSVSGVGENKTIACDGSVVNISGVSNTVTITGHCASVGVSGIENVITVDSTDTIGVSGFDNRIIYHSGTPDVANSGGGNTVEQG